MSAGCRKNFRKRAAADSDEDDDKKESSAVVQRVKAPAAGPLTASTVKAKKKDDSFYESARTAVHSIGKDSGATAPIIDDDVPNTKTGPSTKGRLPDFETRSDQVTCCTPARGFDPWICLRRRPPCSGSHHSIQTVATATRTITILISNFYCYHYLCHPHTAIQTTHTHTAGPEHHVLVRSRGRGRQRHRQWQALHWRGQLPEVHREARGSVPSVSPRPCLSIRAASLPTTASGVLT